eukprot:2206894-Prymnesium_polylepis.1
MSVRRSDLDDPPRLCSRAPLGLGSRLRSDRGPARGPACVSPGVLRGITLRASRQCDPHHHQRNTQQSGSVSIESESVSSELQRGRAGGAAVRAGAWRAGAGRRRVPAIPAHLG